MAYDPLAKWRRQPLSSTGAQPTDSTGYEAHKSDRKTEQLEIRRNGQLAYTVAYRYRLYTTHDGQQGTIINLVFSFMAVEIRGRNLQPVKDALVDERCNFIQDFDARAYPPPAPDQPVIESIKITTQRES
jgi:hypothetical protein